MAVSFDPSKALVLLVGENGVGKSSVVDAIDAVCNGSAGSIRDRSSTNARQHLATAGYTAADVEVAVESESGCWEARLAGDTVIAVPQYDGAPVFVLRRASLLALVDGAPSERFAAIARFVDVAGVERSETALAGAARDAAAAAERIEGALRQAGHGLEELWIQAGRPGAPAGTAVEDWAESQAAAQLDEIEQSAARANAGALAAGQLVRDVELRVAADAHAAAARRAFDAAAGAVAALADGGRGQQLVVVLGEAAALLADHRGHAAATDCPVCERPVDAAELRARVAARLEAARALADAVAAVAPAEQAWRAADEAARAARARVVESARGLAAKLVAVDKLDASARAVVRAFRGEPGPLGVPDSLGASGGAEFDPVAAADALAAHAAPLGERAAAQAARLQQQAGGLAAVRAAYDQVVARRDELHDARRAHGRLAAALTVVRRERTAYVQAVLDAVRDECNRLYAAVHPGEPLGLHRLRLDERRRGSLHQEASFGGRDGVPPQAYFSESHLDTLALCFWLAVARHAARDGAPPVVVFDDVFASLDAAHAERFVRLLAAEVGRGALTQVIVATHDAGWADAVRGEADVVELVRRNQLS